MNMKIWIIIILLLTTIFFLNWHFYPKPIQDVTSAEQEKIIHELQVRRAGDCVVTRASYGFRCEEMGTGRVFRINMN
jgi:hypothetical protein